MPQGPFVYASLVTRQCSKDVISINMYCMATSFHLVIKRYMGHWANVEQDQIFFRLLMIVESFVTSCARMSSFMNVVIQIHTCFCIYLKQTFQCLFFLTFSLNLVNVMMTNQNWQIFLTTITYCPLHETFWPQLLKLSNGFQLRSLPTPQRANQLAKTSWAHTCVHYMKHSFQNWVYC